MGHCYMNTYKINHRVHEEYEEHDVNTQKPSDAVFFVLSVSFVVQVVSFCEVF